MWNSRVFQWVVNQLPEISWHIFTSFSMLILSRIFLMFFYELLPLKWLQNCIKKSSTNHHFLILVRRVPFWGPPCSFWIPFGLHLSSLGLHFEDLGTLWAQFWQLWPPYGCILLVWNRICLDFGCCRSHFSFIFAALHPLMRICKLL